MLDAICFNADPIIYTLSACMYLLGFIFVFILFPYAFPHDHKMKVSEGLLRLFISLLWVPFLTGILVVEAFEAGLKFIRK